MITVLVPSFDSNAIDRLLLNMEERQPLSTMSVIVLDNGLVRRPKARWVKVPTPFVFSQAYNIGCAQAWTHDILSLADDVEILTDGWLDAVYDLSLSWPDGYGAITFEEEKTREFRPDYHGGLITLPDVALGAALLVPRRVLETVGRWDESYVGYGFDDFDYGVRCFHHGLQLGLSDVIRYRDTEQARAWTKRLRSYEAVLDLQDLNAAMFHKKFYGTVPSDLRNIQRPRMAEHFNRASCTCKE